MTSVTTFENENILMEGTFQFSSQNENRVKLAVDFAKLKSPPTGELCLDWFTIQGIPSLTGRLC